MYIKVNGEILNKISKLPGMSESGKAHLKDVEAHKSYIDSFELLFNKFSEEDLQVIYDFAQKETNRSIMMQVKPFLNYKKKKDCKITNITTFAAILEDYIRKDADRYWIYRRVEESDNILLAYFVKSIKYNPGDRKDNPANVEVGLCANSISAFSKSSIIFYTDDLGGSVEDILARKGFLHETDELLKEYIADQNAFMLMAQKTYAQVIANGLFRPSGRYWGDDFVGKTKGIIDMAAAQRSYKTAISAKFWTEEEQPYHMPVHPFIHIFSLTHHVFMNVHIRNVQEYVYDDSLRHKLVLPATHRDLLDILISDEDILKGDIIEGKSTGTTILCKGLPGTGKTLTAEAYSEIAHKPLYKISSAQLGTTPKDVEENLQKVLTRAEKYGAIMLIDEADTYISQRGNNIANNAIVAAFLRTLEYFNGILFLTTNRLDDIDDAIYSRCIATIIYDIPTADAAAKIWQILSKEFSYELDSLTISKLVRIFPSCTGRDIKELTKLTYRFVRAKGKKPEIADFVACAKFRAVRVDEVELTAYLAEANSPNSQKYVYVPQVD